MKSKIIIITGASDGIGAAAAQALTKQGDTVVMVGRSQEKTKKLAQELGVSYYIADFSRLSDVRDLAAKIQNDYPRIDVLINNAGGVFGARQLTPDGFETTLQVNHLAHFLLTDLLMPTLLKSKASVINTSSVAHKIFSNLDINDLNLENSYSPNRAYGNAKFANILFTKELHRRYHGKGLSAVAFHPGKVTTNFAHGSTSWLRFIYRRPLSRLLKFISAEQGADTMVWLAISEPNIDWKSGMYYYKRKLSDVHNLANDRRTAEKLWGKSKEMVYSNVK